MKALNKIGIIVLLVFLSFCSCDSNNPEPLPTPEPIPYMTIDPAENIIINSEKQKIVAILSTNLDNVTMSYQKGGEWVRLANTRALEKEKTEYVFDVDANEGDELRVEFVVFRSGKTAEAITIMQNPAEVDK